MQGHVIKCIIFCFVVFLSHFFISLIFFNLTSSNCDKILPAGLFNMSLLCVDPDQTV